MIKQSENIDHLYLKQKVDFYTKKFGKAFDEKITLAVLDRNSRESNKSSDEPFVTDSRVC
jgi:hypothetical protein